MFATTLKKQINELNWDDIKIKDDYSYEITDIKEEYIERILLGRKINKNIDFNSN